MCKDVPQTRPAGEVDGQREARAYSTADLGAQAAREVTPQEAIDDVFQTLAIEFGDVLQRGPRGLDVRRLQALHGTVTASIERFVHAVERKSLTARSDGYHQGFDAGRRHGVLQQHANEVERRMVGPDRVDVRVAGQAYPESQRVDGSSWREPGNPNVDPPKPTGAWPSDGSPHRLDTVRPRTEWPGISG